MIRKFLWHSFTDSRHPSAEDQRLERQAQRMGASYPSSPVLSQRKVQGGNREHTTREIERAQEVAKGGEKDRCIKGKSCSATCIYHNDDCVVTLSGEVGSSVRQVRDMLKEQVKRGVVTEEQANVIFQKNLGVQDLMKYGPKDELITFDLKSNEMKFNRSMFTSAQEKQIRDNAQEFNSAIENIRQKHGEKEASRRIEEIAGIMVPTTVAREREKISYTPPEALEYIQRNKGTFEELNKIYEEASKLHKEGKLTPEWLNNRLEVVNKVLKPRQGEWDEDDIRLAAAFLTPLERNFYSTAGSLKEGGGLFRKGDQLPSEYGDLNSATKEQQRARILLAAKNILDSNGKNTYTGQPIVALEHDWEHMIPFEAVGRNAEVMQNIGSVTSRENGGKGSKPPSWLYSTGKGGFMEGMEFDSRGFLTPESKEKWERKERAKLEVKQKKEEAFQVGYTMDGPGRAKAAKELLAAISESKMKSDEKLAVTNKLALGFLLSHDRKMAETAGGGIQSHGRGEKRWYYFGKENPKFATFVANKIVELEEKGESGKVGQIAEIMTRLVNNRLNSAIKEELGTNYTYKGKQAFKLGDESTGQVRAIMERLCEEAMAEISAL